MSINPINNIRRRIQLWFISPRLALKQFVFSVYSRINNLRGLRRQSASYPKTIYLSLNSVCNLTCKMCDFGQQDYNSQFYKMTKREGVQELSLEKLRSLIDEVKSFKPLIAATSTEPLLYKNIIEFLSYVKANRLKMQITTNGLLLASFAKAFVAEGLDYLWISLDGPRTVHDKIRGNRQSFQKALEGVELINKEKKRRNKKKPVINVNYTISEYNYNYLSEFMKEIKSLGIKRVTFSHMNYVAKSMAELHNEQFSNICKVSTSSVSAANPININSDQLLQQVLSVSKDYGSKIDFIPSLYSKQKIDEYYNKPENFVTFSKSCRVPWKIAQVLANGDCVTMTRCFDVVFGNIYQEKFSNIWNGTKYRNWRKILIKHGCFPACLRCCGIF